MKRKFSLLAAACLLASTVSLPAANASQTEASTIKGSLVITGGSLGSSNAAVYQSFIKLAGGEKQAKIGIVPAASGKLKSSADFKADLAKYGVDPEHITVLPFSNHDFSDTDFDESNWKNNVNKEEWANQIKNLSAIWFVGGDQLRITKTLRDEKGKNSSALDAIWTMYKKGGVIGGTSAGAAIMSDVMITGGDSLGGLKGEFTEKDEPLQNKEYEPVYIEKGLGFFQYGIVDQHFDERARLGRLAAASIQYEKRKDLYNSYGIDEDTALIVHNAEKKAEIVGRGGVTVIDTSKSKPAGKKVHPVNNVSVSFLSPGDQINLQTKEFAINPDKDGTKGYEYYQFKPLDATGLLTPYGRLKPYLAYSLADNSSSQSVKSYLYDSKGKGYALTFSKTKSTNGYWGYQDGQKDDYSITNVKLDVIPVSVELMKDKTAFKTYKPSNFKVPDKVNRGEISGNLVIAGGALGSSNEAVYKRFIELAGGNSKAKIGIIPAASGSFSSSNAFKNDLVKYGVKDDQIEILPISAHDFKGTAEDESKWKENRNSDETAARIKNLNAIWFVGGDQTYITEALLNPDQSESKALSAIWDIYKKGAVLGGTSAGAAIMSDVMLAGGGSLDTLTKGFTDTYNGMEQQEGGPGYLERGLGFFQNGIIDQHFDNKSRLGRLIATAYEKGDRSQLSYGIDEDTAMVVNNKEQKVEVVGRAGLTVVDLSNAEKKKGRYKNISISALSAGDTVDMKQKTFAISQHKDSTKGYEYGDFKAAPHTGVLTPHGTLKNYLSYNLVDNSGEEKVKSYAFDHGIGVEMIFRKTEETNGFWGYKDGGKDDYSVTHVSLDIYPIFVKIK
ncbi:cyanophycinase [Bacillus sp. FJAT-42376]|uniref:cyanophycinase n=1 Tax=Bacillus sp. FJAT-42376 TaxID=2014076 RepID=UPI000F4E7565|nr:cyanophycinase [Bacillus sp. FJAT-42376]AZB43089.1 cyanophycinase [Bacillus sp. FJAT-42376]